MFAAGLLIALSGAGRAGAQSCSAAYLIDHTSTTGARWEMCFEHRTMDGIVLHDIYFTSPGGTRNKVLGEASVSQIHVPYDDNGARYHDVSDYGIGGSRLNDLQPVDCPGGTRRLHDGKHVLCTTVIDRGFHSWGGEQRGNGKLLEVRSVSHVGAYNYMPVWRFEDDGSIEVAMGATGRLQRVSTSVDREPHGWYISTDTIGLSHLHNYYWRLDFDLGSSATDDVVEEIDFVPSGNRETRSLQITTFTSEVERSIDVDRNRRWRVVDTATNADGHPISWEIEPLLMGHRDIGPSYEEWTFNDLWVTRHRTCERWASHNPTSGGCASQIDEFAGSPSNPSVPESVVGEDIVVWFGLSFHHIPRDEDEPRMPSHWNSFRIVPRDVDAINPLAASPTNAAPTVTAIPGQSNAEGESPSVQAQGSDPDGDPLTWSASGLPSGLSIDDSSGLISGTLDYSSAGNWSVSVTASDGSLSDFTTFSWSVNNTNRAPEISSVGAQSHAEGASVSLQLEGSDPDGETLVWSASGLPPGLSIAPATGLISGVLGFASAGSYEVSASASDGAASDTVTFDWEVAETNRAPEVQNPGPRSDSEGQSVSVQMSGSDPDGNSLTWSAVGLPGALAIDPSSGLISGTLSYTSAGSHSVSVTASDGALSDVVSFSWGVSDTNRPPEISYEGNQQSAEGDPVSQQIEGSDSDGDSLTWSATGLPEGITIAPTSGSITGTLSYESAGAHSVTVTASDGVLSDSVSFSWNVSATNRRPEVESVGAQQAAEGSSASLPMQGSDPDGDSLTWTLSGQPASLTISPTSGLITGTLSYESAGAHSVTVTASDGVLSDSVSFSWLVSATNRRPEVESVGAQQAAEGSSASLPMEGSDPDGDSLTWTVSGLPASLTISPTSGLITGTLSYESAGAHSVTVTASDGVLSDSVSFNWNVSATNRRPEVVSVSAQQAAEGSSASLPMEGSDPDGDSLTWSASGLPASLSIDPSSGLISGTLSYESAGPHSVTVTASDGVLSDSVSFSWNVSATNRRPEVESVGAQQAAEGSSASLPMEGSDPDGDSLTWSASGLPASLSIGPSSGLISGTLSYESAGPHSVTVTASDGVLSDSVSFSWNVSATNRRPEVVSVSAQQAAEGSSASLPMEGSDPDDDSLIWSASGLPASLSIDPSSGLISGTLSYESAGPHSVTVTASDGVLSDSVSFSWNVSATNRRPEVESVGAQQSEEGAGVSLPIEGSDPDGDSLTWTASGLPGSLTISHASGLISGTLSYESAGAHSVTVTASDGVLSDSVSFSWNVSATNRSPQIATLVDVSIAEGDPFALQPQGSDPDGDSLIWSASGLPDGMSIDPLTGQVAGTTSYVSAGVHSVVVEASDGFLSDGVAFVWSVANVNRPPVLGSRDGQEALEGDAFELQITGVDPDDDTLTYSATGLPPGLLIDPATGMIHGDVGLESEGEYTVTVTAHDGELDATAEFVIRVIAPIFLDRFETGDLTSWSSVWPTPEE